MKRRTGLYLAAAGFTVLLASPAAAQPVMLGQVIMMGTNFCPEGTMVADGSSLQISQYEALYYLYGTTYGGNGTTTFNLPDLRGRTVLHTGTRNGNTYLPGQQGGADKTVLTVGQMPSHTHSVTMVGVAGSAGAPNTANPAGASLADYTDTQKIYNSSTAPNTPMAQGTVKLLPNSGSQPVSLLSAYMTVQYCVLTTGIFPSQPQ